MKTCKRCGQNKPIDSFTVDVRYKDGRYPWCAECRAAYRREKRHGANRDETLAYHREYREQRADEARRQEREYYHEHKDKWRRQESKKWHNDPNYRAKKNQQRRNTYQNNVAARARRIHFARTRHHRLYYSDPKYRQYKRSYNAAYDPRRNRYGRDARGKFTQAEWTALCARYDHRCLCCGAQKPLSPDHVIPLSRGGANTIDNIQPLCRDCNVSKFTKTMDFRPDWVGF